MWKYLGAPGSTTMVSAAKGLPFAIIGTFGPSAWKLAAHPSITSVQELRGKTVGISRPGTTIEFATRRALKKLGFTPGKDIQILATGLAESNKRIMVMLQGKIDATLVSPDNLFEAEQKDLKLSVLSELKDLGIYTSASDLSAKRDFLKNQRQRARGFMMAYCEAIWLGKANKNVALASFRKHMREQDPRRLEALHKNYVVDALPLKPYPMEEVIQAEMENLTPTVPEFRGKKAADFVDKSLLADLDREGFFNQLASKYGKQIQTRSEFRSLVGATLCGCPFSARTGRHIGLPLQYPPVEQISSAVVDLRGIDRIFDSDCFKRGESDSMPYFDLHQHLKNLEEHGLLRRITRLINKDTELHPLVRWQYRGLPEEDRRAWLFENVTDAKGKHYTMPVVVGALAGKPEIYYLGMGCNSAEEMDARWKKALAEPINPIAVSKAKCQDVVILGDELDKEGNGLDRFPVPISTPGFRQRSVHDLFALDHGGSRYRYSKHRQLPRRDQGAPAGRRVSFRFGAGCLSALEKGAGEGGSSARRARRRRAADRIVCFRAKDSLRRR